MISAKSSVTVIVVVNGSPIPSVTGLLPSGTRGIFATAALRLGISRASWARVAAGSPLLRALRASTIAWVSWATFSTPCWASAVWPSGPLPFATCFSSLLAQRRVDQVQQRVVLPQAEAERDRERDRADDQAGAQLVEMVHEAEPVLVADRADRGGHGPYEPTTA